MMRFHFSARPAALAAALVSISAPAAAQTAAGASPPEQVAEQVVVTATRLGGIRSDLLGSSATILEPIDLQARQVEIVSDILRDVPGVAVSRAGPVGQFTQLRLRGAESNHTLTLIDGIKVSDPFYGEFDFATLIADDVAKIEVLRGEQSALYGSDAIGGVIQYITATGTDAPGISARIEGGSVGTVDGTMRAAGVVGALDYALSGAYYRTDGMPDNPSGTRKLGAENTALSGKFAYALSSNFRLKAVTRYSATDADVNQQDFNFPPAPTYGFEVDGNGSYKNRALYGLFSGELELLDGRWKHALTVQGMDAERNGYGNSGFSADARSSGDEGARERASYVTLLGFGTPDAAQTINAAVDYERESYRNSDPTGFADTSTRHSENYGVVGEYLIVFDDRLALGGAARFDKDYRFADAFTYHLEASYRFDNGLRPHAAAGTGIKSPGIYELYGYTPGPGSFIGNPDLKPERSQGWEAGFDQRLLGGAAILGLTYFSSHLRDEIFTAYVGPSFVASPQNATTQSKRAGIEASASARIGEEWRVDLAYTYLNAIENGQQEVRRAPHIASFNVAWRAPGDRYGANLTVRYNGEQKDLNFTLSRPPRVTLPSFILVNLGADYRLNDTLQLYARAENLFDAKYQEVYTIHERGRAVFAGLRTGF
jgi:vitamin B12 transporter